VRTGRLPTPDVVVPAGATEARKGGARPADGSLMVAVVTATWNRRALLERCLESVTGQRYARKQHVVVDGGSRDGTVELLRAYAARHPHVTWISEPDRGISEALNKGLALVTGDVIAVIGDDDAYEPGAFEAVARAFRDGVSIVAGSCDVVNDEGEVTRTLQASFAGREELVEYWRYWSNTVTLPAPTTFFRASVLAAVGGFDVRDRYAMDYRHWLRMTERFDVATIPDVLARHRYDEGTITFSRRREQAREMRRISMEHWGPRLGSRFLRLSLSYLRRRTWPRFKQDVKRVLVRRRHRAR
jgi:glycosyltransferase involved in cell wall biosynthesis